MRYLRFLKRMFLFLLLCAAGVFLVGTLASGTGDLPTADSVDNAVNGLVQSLDSEKSELMDKAGRLYEQYDEQYIEPADEAIGNAAKHAFSDAVQSFFANLFSSDGE